MPNCICFIQIHKERQTVALICSPDIGFDSEKVNSFPLEEVVFREKNSFKSLCYESVTATKDFCPMSDF